MTDDTEDRALALARSLTAYNALKQEHITQRQAQPGLPRDWQDDDTALLSAMFGSSGVDSDVVATCGVLMVDVMMHQIRRAGILRAANQRQLRALLFSAWIDGLGLGLYHGTHPPDPDPEGPR